MTQCDICKDSFEPNKRNPKQKYCTKNCAREAHRIGRRKDKRRDLFHRECVFCLVEFETKTHNKQCCSKKCQRSVERARFYGMSNIEFRDSQNKNACEICYKTFTNDRCIDHSHVDGHVRGILCRACNAALGHFRDSENNLKSAIEYLSKKNNPIKADIVAYMKKLYNFRWITSRDGNISVRNGDKLYITKSSVNKSTITVEDVIEIDIVGEMPFLPNNSISIEFEMHWLLLRDKNVGAVIHCHPINPVAIMEKKLELSDVCKAFPEVTRYTKIGKNVPYLEPGSGPLAEKVFENMAFYDIVGMRAHGVTSFGVDLEKAFEHIERVDHICQIVLASGRK